MKKLITTLTAISAVATTLTASTINAVKVDGDVAKLTPTSSVWSTAKYSDVTLYPQTTVRMNDKKANELNAGNKAKHAKVAAVYNGKDIALLVKWNDSTINAQMGYKTDVYGDGFAVQFAKNFDGANKLPYIGMGSDGREVLVYLQKYTGKVYEPNGNGDVSHQVNRDNTNAFGNDLKKFDKEVKDLGKGDYQRAFVSGGFRSMTEIKDGSANFNMRLQYGNGGWMGLITRPLSDEYTDLNKDAFPIAIATWDGAKNNRDGLKSLSSWNVVQLGKDDTLSKVVNEEVKGDAANGKLIAMDNCAACHTFEGADMAPYTMAPALNNIGGYATAAYIRESIVDPNAVIVPGYNRNAHKNTPWYNVENGKRVSAMPSFDWLDETSLNDVVAFLQTLKTK